MHVSVYSSLSVPSRLLWFHSDTSRLFCREVSGWQRSRDADGFRRYSWVSSTGWHLSSASVHRASPWDGGRGHMLAGRWHIWGIKLPCRGPDTFAQLLRSPALTVNMFVENLSSALFFYFLSRTASLFFLSLFFFTLLPQASASWAWLNTSCPEVNMWLCLAF